MYQTKFRRKIIAYFFIACATILSGCSEWDRLPDPLPEEAKPEANNKGINGTPDENGMLYCSDDGKVVSDTLDLSAQFTLRSLMRTLGLTNCNETIETLRNTNPLHLDLSFQKQNKRILDFSPLLIAPKNIETLDISGQNFPIKEDAVTVFKSFENLKSLTLRDKYLSSALSDIASSFPKLGHLRLSMVSEFLMDRPPSIDQYEQRNLEPFLCNELPKMYSDKFIHIVYWENDRIDKREEVKLNDLDVIITETNKKLNNLPLIKREEVAIKEANQTLVLSQPIGTNGNRCPSTQILEYTASLNAVAPPPDNNSNPAAPGTTPKKDPAIDEAAADEATNDAGNE